LNPVRTIVNEPFVVSKYTEKQKLTADDRYIIPAMPPIPPKKIMRPPFLATTVGRNEVKEETGLIGISGLALIERTDNRTGGFFKCEFLPCRKRRAAIMYVFGQFLV